MPMEMSNSPAVFQRLMELVLIYLDDVLVFGSDFDEQVNREDVTTDKRSWLEAQIRDVPAAANQCQFFRPFNIG